MKFVEPIRDVEKIEEMKSYLKKRVHGIICCSCSVFIQHYEYLTY